jgi:chromosome segregation ATPase
METIRMESSRLTAISAELQQERTQVTSEATRLREQLAAVETSLTRIDAALAALDANCPLPRASKQSRPSDAKKITTPSPKKADVIQAMRTVLEQVEVLAPTALKMRVESELQKLGFNRFGLAMRFKEACDSPQFLETPIGLRLVEERTLASVGR